MACVLPVGAKEQRKRDTCAGGCQKVPCPAPCLQLKQALQNGHFSLSAQEVEQLLEQVGIVSYILSL